MTLVDFQHKVDFLIHFAAMKAVGESMQKPLFYYKNNIVSTINVLEVSEKSFYLVFFSLYIDIFSLAPSRSSLSLCLVFSLSLSWRVKAEAHRV